MARTKKERKRLKAHRAQQQIKELRKERVKMAAVQAAAFAGQDLSTPRPGFFHWLWSKLRGRG
ncbi:hypothetical protein ETW23_07695 [Leisingera sp. NJS201]|uniref:hypothetical protein n=1 Tax=Leisingera sp. NJS201 TaxID=2508306 RepID=UPI001071539B|nr:hypothetical protein [Leisingera sp. NJS201]QBR36039.1 hypothetical protein ETW23_07695 [Leisingera sp. NJS201]